MSEDKPNQPDPPPESSLKFSEFPREIQDQISLSAYNGHVTINAPSFRTLIYALGGVAGEAHQPNLTRLREAIEDRSRVSRTNAAWVLALTKTYAKELEEKPYLGFRDALVECEKLFKAAEAKNLEWQEQQARGNIKFVQFPKKKTG